MCVCVCVGVCVCVDVTVCVCSSVFGRIYLCVCLCVCVGVCVSVCRSICRFVGHTHTYTHIHTPTHTHTHRPRGLYTQKGSLRSPRGGKNKNSQKNKYLEIQFQNCEWVGVGKGVILSPERERDTLKNVFVSGLCFSKHGCFNFIKLF